MKNVEKAINEVQETITKNQKTFDSAKADLLKTINTDTEVSKTIVPQDKLNVTQGVSQGRAKETINIVTSKTKAKDQATSKDTPKDVIKVITKKTKQAEKSQEKTSEKPESKTSKDTPKNDNQKGVDDLFNSHKFDIGNELDTITKKMITDFIEEHAPTKSRIVNVSKDNKIEFKFGFAITKKHAFYCYPVATFRYMSLQKNDLVIKPVGTCRNDHKKEQKLLNVKWNDKSKFNYLTFYNKIGKFNFVIDTHGYYIMKLPKFLYVLVINKKELENVKLNSELVKFTKLTF